MGTIQSIPSGCSRSIDTLIKTWPDVVSFSKEEQSAYADDEFRAEAKNAAFCERQLAAIRAGFPMQPPNNTTDVGNLAYMALHAHADHREDFGAIHLAYTAMLMRRYGLR